MYMKTRQLGTSGLEIAPLALGGNVFGWTADENMSFRLLDAFIDSGLNLVDTADVYSVWAPGHTGGESETVIGKWLKRTGKREKIVIATKVGMEMSPSEKGLSRKHILQSAERSLARLQTDYIDLYQSHIDDTDTPIEETLGGYAQLAEQGKIRAIGASNYGAERLAQALATSGRLGYPAYQSLQPHYNLYDCESYERDLEPFCAERKLGVIPYFSLARGFLSGKYRAEEDLSKSVRGGGVKRYLNDRGFRILSALDRAAKELNSSPASVSLAWLIARPGITAPIASATNLDQLAQLIGATNLKLDQATIDLLNSASAWGAEEDQAAD